MSRRVPWFFVGASVYFKNMKKKYWVAIFLIAVIFKLWVFSVITSPRSLDEIYYIECAKKIVSGQGFKTDIIWHYISNDLGAKKDAFILWMPLNSIILAFAGLFSKIYIVFKIIPFLLSLFSFFIIFKTFKCIFPQRNEFIIVASMSALFSLWFSPYLVTCDNFSLYLFLGSSFFYFISRSELVNTTGNAVMIGLICSFLHLTRSDGIYFIVIVLLSFLLSIFTKKGKLNLRSIIIILSIYLICMSPWLVRNMKVFGKVLPGDVKKMIMMEKYEEICNPGNNYNFASLLKWDLIKLRIESMKYSFTNLSIIMSNLIFSPFLVIGFIAFLKERKMIYFYIYFFFLVFVNGLLFPNAYMNGTLWHSSVVLLPFLNLCTFYGLIQFIDFFKTKLFKSEKSNQMHICTIFIVIMILSSIGWTYAFTSQWDPYKSEFLKIGKLLKDDNCTAVVSHYPGKIYVQVLKPSFILPLDSVKSFTEVINKNMISHVVIRRKEMKRYLLDSKEYLKYIKNIGETKNFLVFASRN